jgi:hypothetical protein
MAHVTKRNPDRCPTHPGALLREDVIPATGKTKAEIAQFAEDLSRSLSDLGVLPMHEADAAIDSVTVTKVHANQLRRCRGFVDRLLEKHFLINDCAVVEQNGGTVSGANIGNICLVGAR